MRRWVNKLFQEAETIEEAAEKIAVAYIWSKLIPEVKNYLDLSEANTMPRYHLNGRDKTHTSRTYIDKKEGMESTTSIDKAHKLLSRVGLRRM